jgi:hypothetical protein
LFSANQQPSFLLTANSGGQNQYLNNDKDGLEKYRLHNKKEGIMDAATNLQNMKNLDDSWNGQDLQTFRKYHAKDCVVRWPNQPPTHGVDAHEQEAIAFFKMFPDQHLINNPYKIMLAQGEWTCTVADFTGTMKGAMTMPDGTVIQPTNKGFHIDFCTVARWNEQGQIVEENLFYDLMGMLKQIGAMPAQVQKAA